MSLNNIKISYRLIASYVVVVGLMLMLSFVAIKYMKDLSGLTNKLYKHPYTVSTAMLRIKGNIAEIDSLMKSLILTKERKQLALLPQGHQLKRSQRVHQQPRPLLAQKWSFILGQHP